MAKIAIDTNVLAIANGHHDQASSDCVACCVERLIAARERDVVLVDSGQSVFSEYRKYCSARGQPGIGDGFFKWLWNRRSDPNHCNMIALTPLADPRDFEEFPASLRKAGFDLNDRKFVALALVGAPGESVVVNGLDRGYERHEKGLNAVGVSVEFLCLGQCGGIDST